MATVSTAANDRHPRWGSHHGAGVAVEDMRTPIDLHPIDLALLLGPARVCSLRSGSHCPGVATAQV